MSDKHYGGHFSFRDAAKPTAPTPRDVLADSVFTKLLRGYANRAKDALDVERLAKATFLYRTSSNVKLPDDYWEQQHDAMQRPYLDEAKAIAAEYARLAEAER